LPIRSFTQWNEIFGDPVIATAILDRILHHSMTINIKGKSYRLKEKVKAGGRREAEVEAAGRGEGGHFSLPIDRIRANPQRGLPQSL
jgi:hypothetical protein